MTAETLYWFFSTLAQTLGALVGVVGMLTVFRLQNIYNSINSAMKGSSDLRRSCYGSPYHLSQTTEQFIETWPEKIERESNLLSHDTGKDLHKTYKYLIYQISLVPKIRRSFYLFLLSNLTVIFSSLICILFMEKIFEYLVSIMFMVVGVILLFITMVPTFRLCVLFIDSPEIEKYGRILAKVKKK